MKIKDIETIILHSPEPSFSSAPSVLMVKVETDDGIVGVGEGCTSSEYDEGSYSAREIIERGFKPLLLGENPLHIRRLWQKLYDHTEYIGRRGIVIFALSAIDIALWDIMGKYLEQPIHNLLGGKFRDTVRVYASLIFDLDDPESCAKEGKRYVDQGYTALKYGWGKNRETAFGLSPERDERAVRTIREVVGNDVDLLIDVGRYPNWSPPYALSMARRLFKYRPYCLEEPLPQDDIAGYSWLTSRSRLPIAMGEGYYTRWEFREVMMRRAAHILQPDCAKMGGITEFKRVADMAEMWNVPIVPHGFSSTINIAANAQLVASMRSAPLMEFRRTKSPLIDNLTKNLMEVENGFLKIPSDPGLGIALNEETVDKYRIS